MQCSAFGFSHRSITQIPSSGLNASVAHLYPQSGTTAVVFQSSALCAGVLDWAAQHGIGFSILASLGRSARIDAAQLIDFLGVLHL